MIGKGVLDSGHVDTAIVATANQQPPICTSVSGIEGTGGKGVAGIVLANRI
jgi:hypothetical protein